MSRNLRFYYDFLSPYSYLASTQLPEICARHNCVLEYRPVNVIRLMERTGNQPTTVLCEAKLAYAFQDLERWARKYGVPIVPNPHFREIDVTPLLLGAIAANDAGLVREYTRAIFEAYWVKQSPFKDEAELVLILEAAGLSEPTKIVSASGDLADRLEENIDLAEKDGVFGVPSFVGDVGLFFGNDRLDFLEEELAV